jgi:hypothetical protein
VSLDKLYSKDGWFTSKDDYGVFGEVWIDGERREYVHAVNLYRQEVLVLVQRDDGELLLRGVDEPPPDSIEAGKHYAVKVTGNIEVRLR